MYMLHSCRNAGLSAVVLERGSGVGGTWYWNRYPGARCDVPSLEYSYQFSDDLQQEWEWSEKYATQPEILRYAEHVADRFDLKRDIRFDSLVTAITFDDSTNVWTTTLADGELIECWVYEFNPKYYDRRAPIASGDWIAHAAEKGALPEEKWPDGRPIGS